MMKIAKGFVGLAAFLTLIVGIVMLGITIWAFVRSSIFFNNYAFLGVLLASDLLIIIASLLGIFGAKRQNGALLWLFQILVVILFFAFLALGITAQVIPGYLFKDTDTCENHPLEQFQIAKTSYQQSTLCITCACDLSNATINNGDYNWLQQALLYGLYRQSGTALKFQDCPFIKNSTSYKSVYSVLEGLENALDCSGWCDTSGLTPLLYQFSDVNRGKPKSTEKKTTCYYQLKDFIHTYAGIVGIASFIAAALMAVVFLLGLRICMGKKNQPMLSRFIQSPRDDYNPLQ